VKSHNGPWKITSSKVKYENPWISVREDRVIQIDGKPGLFGIVTVSPGVSVLAVDADYNVYLTRQFRYAMEQECLEAIGGVKDQGEDWIQTARRELKEESGITAAKWTDLGPLDPLTSIISVRARLFLAEDLTLGERNLDGNEKIDIIKMPFAEALEKAKKGEVADSPTLILLYKTALLRPELLK